MTPASRYPFGPRGAARYLQAVHSLVAQYGGDCWPLDDAPGSAVARSLTGAYPGAVSATGVTFGQQGPLCAGQYAGAAGFDGAVSNPIVTTFCPAEAWTHLGWIRRVVTDVYSASICSLNNGLSNTISLNLAGNLRPIIYCSGNNFRYFNSVNSDDGGWHFFCAVLPGADQNAITASKFYWDGVPVSVVGTNNSAPQQARTSFCVGTQNPVHKWIGHISFLACLPSAALSAEEIRTLYLTATQGD